MSETPFHRTEKGRIVFEQVLPALLAELTRFDELLGHLLESLPAAPTPAGESPNREEQAS